MLSIKVTAVANTAAQLVPADSFRNGARVENPLAVPIYVSTASTPTSGPPSITVPPVDAYGNPGWYTFDGTCIEQWFYKTASAGDFTVTTW